MSVPPGASRSLGKVGRTFLSGQEFMFFNRLLEQVALAWARGKSVLIDETLNAASQHSDNVG